jgi:hypothetical protein
VCSPSLPTPNLSTDCGVTQPNPLKSHQTLSCPSLHAPCSVHTAPLCLHSAVLAPPARSALASSHIVCTCLLVCGDCLQAVRVMWTDSVAGCRHNSLKRRLSFTTTPPWVQTPGSRGDPQRSCRRVSKLPMLHRDRSGHGQWRRRGCHVSQHPLLPAVHPPWPSPRR